MRTKRYAGALALIAMLTSEAGVAQVPAPIAPPADGTSPFGAPTDAGEASAVTMPRLTFVATGTEAADFDKYYAFHRDGTDYASAYADVVECDGYARGLQSGVGYVATPYPYAGTMAGAVGGAIGNVLAVAIFGSAEKRRLRRVNMRTCMYFKGYDRYGLSKDVWETFNFEEGLSGVDADKRRTYLRQQALVASSGTLPGKALGL